MIDMEIYKVTSDGRTLIRTYSTLNMYIERDGVQYSEAIDDIAFGYKYNETDIPIEKEEE